MITQERRTRLEKAIKHYLKYLNLECWEIRIKDDEPEKNDDNPIASISPIEGRNVADLRIDNSFFEDSLKCQHHTLIHELTHLPSDKMINHVRCLTRNMSYEMKQAVYDCILLEAEHFTDHFATCFSNLIPIAESLKEAIAHDRERTSDI